MRAFDELCVSQGIDPRDLEEAFVSDNLALTAQNELLRQEVDSLRAALAGRREASSTALAVHRIPEQGKAENEDLDHVLSEALDFVSTKTGYAMNLVKKKVARILQPVSDFVEHSTSRSEEVERLKEDLASAKEAVEILSQERNGVRPAFPFSSPQAQEQEHITIHTLFPCLSRSHVCTRACKCFFC